MNRIAERDNLDVRTEHLSFAARGIDKEPTQKMGYTGNAAWPAGHSDREGRY